VRQLKAVWRQQAGEPLDRHC